MMNVDNGDTHTNGAGANANSEEDDVSVSSRVSNNDATRLSLKEKQEEIAQHESRWVFRLRLLVALVLVVSTVAVVVAVHFYLTDEEEEKFESSFETSAAKVYEAIGKTLDQTLGSTDAFLLQYVVNTHVEEGADAAGEDQTRGWPFATMPGFALQASKLLKLSKSFQLAISHIVEPEQRLDWENYTSQNRQWIDESLDVMEQDPDWHGPVTRNYKLSPHIEGYTNPSVSREMGPLNNVTTPYMNNYLPQWQSHLFVGAPPESTSATSYNWDTWQVPAVARSIQAAFQDQSVVIAPVGNIVANKTDQMQVLLAAAAQDFASRYVDNNRRSPLGVLVFGIFWKQFIQNILPRDNDGIVVVFTDTCGPPFTYQLNGPEAIYLGPGDLHDAAYDSLGQHYSIGEIMDFTQDSAEGSSYTGLPVSETFCPRTVHIYPSDVFYDSYVTNNPAVFTTLAAVIFLFTSVVFVMYDCIVERRQRIVKKQALASGAIVSSLFPEQVRHHLYKEQRQQEQQQQQQEQKLAKRQDLNSVLSRASNDILGGNISNDKTAEVGKSPPIADMYQETTIFFADLAGFTAWSSKRTPIEVFELLETLYGAFDMIAMKRKVFKVETIGDCYVAITGCPEPQEDHAENMVKFARDCMLAMNKVTADLSDSLGQDTKDLGFRVGLHSGPTTAGVLRGHKGRFQLFGDTVNTASRMESNGVPGRIHVSESTADCLRAANKKQWLTPREDKITAKGKGEMQTYWVNPAKGLSPTMSVSTSSSC